MWTPGCSIKTSAADATAAHTGSKQHQYKNPASGDRVMWEVPRALSLTLRVEETGMLLLIHNRTHWLQKAPAQKPGLPQGDRAMWEPGRKPAVLMLQPHPPNSTKNVHTDLTCCSTRPLRHKNPAFFKGTEPCGNPAVLMLQLHAPNSTAILSRYRDVLCDLRGWFFLQHSTSSACASSGFL